MTCHAWNWLAVLLSALASPEYRCHGCHRSLGCLDPQCVLCEHNPHRRCNVNFAPKYLVNDVLKAKCDAPIRVEIIDRQTGVPLGEDIADVHLEVRCLGLTTMLLSISFCVLYFLASCHTARK